MFISYTFVNGRNSRSEAAVCGCYGTPRRVPTTTSTSSLEADIGGEEEPEYVASGEDYGSIPRDGANTASMISSW